MFSTIYAGAIHGISAYLVAVEVDIARGLPAFTMVGSLSCEVRESRERVCVALKNAGFDLPPNHVTVNLSPADRRKEGTAFDLPIGVGMLASLDYFPQDAAADTLFLGELGLNGEIKKVRGVLPIVREAAAKGIRQCIVPAENAAEGAVIPDIAVRGASDIRQVLEFLQAKTQEQRERVLPCLQMDMQSLFSGEKVSGMPDFAQVSGQETARRAAEIAAAGFHNLLMIGPPGAGKSMIARRIPGIMPQLSVEESLEVTSVASVAGLTGEGTALMTDRPFQNPHHTVSQAALIGGSTVPKPGIISLAHRGVLFLDELPEFRREVLDSLRQPLEEHKVNLSRTGGNVTYPSDFMLVCAMNPCPCGYYPDKNRCRCTQPQVRKYMGRVSGPILDRIDLCVELQPVDLPSLRGGSKGESSACIRQRVSRARELQEKRFAGTAYRFNADIEATDIERYCPLGEAQQHCMEQLYHSLQLSARAFHRILKVSRTIADLSGSQQIGVEHLLEASFYRPAQEYWS